MSGFAGDNNDSGSESSSPKYSIHPTFSGAYYSDITKPEEYYTDITILNDIMSAFSKLISENTKYSYLRVIDISKIEIGDKISVLGLDDEYEILKIDESTIEIDFNESPLEINKANVRLIDSCLSKLKRTDISFIYTEISKIILNDHYSCIEFFNIFSEYFKINEKTLYNSLPHGLQLELLDNLQKRLNMSFIDPENQLKKGVKVKVMRGEYQSCNNINEYHVLNTEMYGEVIGLIKNEERSKYRLKVRIQTETNSKEINIDIITKLSKVKLFKNDDIDLVW